MSDLKPQEIADGVIGKRMSDPDAENIFMDFIEAIYHKDVEFLSQVAYCIPDCPADPSKVDMQRRALDQLSDTIGYKIAKTLYSFDEEDLWSVAEQFVNIFPYRWMLRSFDDWFNWAAIKSNRRRGLTHMLFALAYTDNAQEWIERLRKSN